MATKSSSNKGNDKGGGNGNQEAANAEADGAPTMNVLGQYVKDLSFENPGAPNSLASKGQNPNIQVNINVNAKLSSRVRLTNIITTSSALATLSASCTSTA